MRTGEAILGEAKKKKAFKVGHIVRWTRDFLRSTGMQVGAPINGNVTALKKGGSMEGWPMVHWSDAKEAKLVNPANLEFDPKGKAINKKVDEKEEKK